jgi:hypothetical protein
VDSAPKMVRVACSDIRKAKRYLVAVSHGRTLATIGGAKGYRDTIDNAAMVIELDRAADELGASTGRLYRPGNPDPVAISIDRFGALPPGPVPTAIAPVQSQDDRELLARCWDSAIEVGHETIARDVELPPAALAIQQWINGRKDTFKLRDFQRSGLGELKGLNADSILAVLQILEAAGVGQLWNDGQGWRFRLL